MTHPTPGRWYRVVAIGCEECRRKQEIDRDAGAGSVFGVELRFGRILHDGHPDKTGDSTEYVFDRTRLGVDASGANLGEKIAVEFLHAEGLSLVECEHGQPKKATPGPLHLEIVEGLGVTQDAVRAFHERFGFEIRETPGVPRTEILQLALKLINEECDELHEACGLRWNLGDWCASPTRYPDLPKIAHELADLVYVTLGMAVRFGIDLGPIFAAIHAANLSKEKAFREDGKLVKTERYKAPDVAGILARQAAP